MTNPFVFGSIVEGEHFANRSAEIKELEESLSKSENILLLSPRKYGKRSLLIEALNKMREKGLLCIFINLNRVTSFHKLLGLYVREIVLEAEKDKNKAMSLFNSMFPKEHRDVSLDFNDGDNPGMREIEEKAIQSEVRNVFCLPQKIASEKKKNFVIAFGEFQEMESLDGDNTLKYLKSCVRKDKNVSYFFSCINFDDINELNKVCEDYKIDKVIELKKISRESFMNFLEDKFEKTGFEVEQGVVWDVLEKTNDYPYNAQFLCHELWNIKHDEKKVKKEDISTALHEILKKQSPFYVSIWNSLTVRQRNVLCAVAQLGGEQIFSRKFTNQGGLGSVSSLQTSVQLLRKKNILTKIEKRHEFTDVFFREWIRSEIQ